MSNYFIMLNHPNGSIVPMEDEAENVLLFDDLEDAVKCVDDNDFAQAFGYEVFQRGMGEQ